MKRSVFLLFLTPLAISILVSTANGQKETTAPANKAYKIALSNSFYGNTWRKQMVDVMQKAAEGAKAQHYHPTGIENSSCDPELKRVCGRLSSELV